MNRLFKLAGIILILTITFPILFYCFCRVCDSIFIEPVIEAMLKEHNAITIDEKLCMNSDQSKKSQIACLLLSENEMAEDTIKRKVGETFEFKKSISIDHPDIKRIDDGDLTIWALFVELPKYYDAYRLRFSDRFVPEWNYSLYDIFANYESLTNRFAAVVLTYVEAKGDLVVKKERQLLIVSEKKGWVTVRSIHDDHEAIYFFQSKAN